MYNTLYFYLKIYLERGLRTPPPVGAPPLDSLLFFCQLAL